MFEFLCKGAKYPGFGPLEIRRQLQLEFNVDIESVDLDADNDLEWPSPEESGRIAAVLGIEDRTNGPNAVDRPPDNR